MVELNPQGIMALVDKRMEKTVKFLGANVKIFKLSLEEVEDIQTTAKEQAENAEGLDVLKKIIRLGVEYGDKIMDEHFRKWPIDELSNLSQEIMKFSGIQPNQGNAS